jgi:hypothetical protein
MCAESALSAGNLQMPDASFRWAHTDFNVAAQPCQAVHQFALGQIAEIAAHHVGHLGFSLSSWHLSTPQAHRVPSTQVVGGIGIQSRKLDMIVRRV